MSLFLCTELVPKFEFFVDRLEITSAGVVHPGKEQDDFFAGYSMPRNKTLMRVFKDLEMVEYLGSGMPRILKAYHRESYTFSTHFIRTTFPISTEALALKKEVALGEKKIPRAQSGAQSGAQPQSIVSALSAASLSAAELIQALGLESKTGAFKRTIKELLEQDIIEYAIPDKPTSRLQK